MKRINLLTLISNVCLAFSVMLTFFAIVFNVLGVSALYSFSLRFNIVLYFSWLALFVVINISVFKKNIFKQDEFKTIVLVTMCIITMIICCFMNIDKSYLSFSYFNKSFMSLSFVIQIVFFTHTYITRVLRKTISIFSIIAIFIFLLLFVFKFRFSKNPSYLGTSNPNEAAVYLTAFAFSAIYCLKLFENFLIKMISFLAFGIACFLIYITGSRNAIITIALFVVLLLIYVLKFKQSTYINVLFVLLPFFVVMIYMIIAYNFIDSSLMNIYSSKSIATRKAIWCIGLKLFINSPVFGNYYQMVVTSPLEQGLPLYTVTQLHSTFVDTLTTYGIVYTILQSLILVRFLNSKIQINQNIRRNCSILSAAILPTFIFIGLFEAGIYLSMYCFVCSIFLVSGEIIHKSNSCDKAVFLYYYEESNSIYFKDKIIPTLIKLPRANMLVKTVIYFLLGYSILLTLFRPKGVITNIPRIKSKYVLLDLIQEIDLNNIINISFQMHQTVEINI